MLYDIHLPEVKTIESDGNRAVFVIEPLYPGYGLTLGNALRRTILSSLPGAAVTAVKIDGVPHEFTAINGVKEDAVEVILNLKQLRFVVHGDGPYTCKLDIKGAKKVSAKDVSCPSEVEIVNKDQHIATLAGDKAKLSMEIRVERGRGYVPVEDRGEENLEVGTIAVDAIYTPIRRVRYNIENTRVGGMTNLDKLVLEIETDGAIDPETALREASTILVDHFMVVSGREVTRELGEMAAAGANPEAEKILIEEVNFSPRTANALLKNGLKSIADILELPDTELKNLKGLGTKAYEEIKEKLAELGYLASA